LGRESPQRRSVASDAPLLRTAKPASTDSPGADEQLSSPSFPILLALSAADNTVLSLKNVQVLYDRAIEAVRDVSLDVPAGAIVALLGSNGAGKSTILKAISGVLEQEDGEIVNGSVHLDGARISGRSPREIVRAGLLQVRRRARCSPHLPSKRIC
jgi:ATPase subunit of ABC transporter with duplicated ATPase domains